MRLAVAIVGGGAKGLLSHPQSPSHCRVVEVQDQRGVGFSSESVPREELAGGPCY